MAQNKQIRNKLFSGKNQHRRNFVIAVSAACVVVLASMLILTFATSPPSFNLGRKAFSTENFRAKGYSPTSISTVVNQASTTPSNSQSCRDAWNPEPRINTSFHYFCWHSSDLSGGWITQGITGSSAAQTNSDSGNNDLIIVSWYTTGKPSLVASTQTSNDADSASRISILNTRTNKYAHVELVKPCSQSPKQICKLNSHAGGIAWAGQYLYVASTTGMYVFNVNDMFTVDGKPVMVATEWYGLKYRSGEAKGRISTVSFDTSANQLVTAEYHLADTGQPSWIVRWNLDSSHHLSRASDVASARKFSIKAYSVQGIASYNGTYIAHSSSETAPGRGSKGGTLLKWQKPSSLTRYRMPYHIESAYIDVLHKRIWGVTETGSHSNTPFVLSYPMDVAF